MYSENASFEFINSAPQSARLQFLAEMADSLERSVDWDRTTPNPGFSIDLRHNGNTEVFIWHPGIANAMWSQLYHGEETGIIRVTKPKHFSRRIIKSDGASSLS